MNVYRLIAAGVTTRAADLSLRAPIGSFPVPPGTHLVADQTCNNGVVIKLDSVAPARVSAFYASALPRAGYKITDNSLPVPSSLYMNSLEISLTPPGQASALPRPGVRHVGGAFHHVKP
jgi:hypothetical protein